MSFYSCSASTHDGLVGNLRKTGVIRSDAVFDAMLKTDRGKYMAQLETPDGGHVGELACYADSPHPIGYNQTISAPHMVGLFSCVSLMWTISMWTINVDLLGGRVVL